jgi:UPF0755 protein
MAFLLLKPLGRLLSVVILAVVVGALWFLLQLHPLGGSGREAFFTVHEGDSIATVAGEMHTAGVLSSPLAYRLDTTLFGAPNVIPGTYGITQGASFSEITSILSHAPNVLDVTPGLTLHEIALDVANHSTPAFADQFVADEKNATNASIVGKQNSLEGLVGPGRYVITPGETPEQLLAMMTQSFGRLTSSLGLTASTSINGLDAYQLVIAASIVEKEGYYPKNMPKVARVIFNRLARGGPLQMDATVLYYFNQDGGTVTHAMLQTKTPYNTYLNLGLTPTPICTVSKYSLNAVLHAPAGSWLYFQLIDKNGDEAFSTTFAQQLQEEQLAASRGLA